MARTVDPVKHEAKRQQIIGAAYLCFSRKGFSGTTTADIAREAGVSTGNLFHYFPSKEAIFAAIFEGDGPEVSERLTEAAHSDDPWGGLMTYLEHALSEAADPNAAGFVLAVMSHANHDEAFAALLEKNDSAQLEGLTVLLRRAAELEQTDSSIDPETAASWVALLIDGLFMRMTSDPSFKPLEQLPTLKLLLSRFLKAEVD